MTEMTVKSFTNLFCEIQVFVITRNMINNTVYERTPIKPKKKILIIEPFYSGSHRAWADQLVANSRHDIELLTLPGRYWKWRMHGGAVRLARLFNERGFDPDLIIATDMLDATTFLSLTRKKTHSIPVATYFHENQLAYPWSPTDNDTEEQKDIHYHFINYTTALTSDINLFNSHYNMKSFTDALPDFLKQFPDYREGNSIQAIKNKCRVLHLGLDLRKYDSHKTAKQFNEPVILWNHRWDHDKNPDLFFKTLFMLKKNNIPFRLIVTGEEHGGNPEIFKRAESVLSENIIHFGHVDSFKKYAELLWQADIIPVTSMQDFFGISIMEAVYCGAIPLLPKRLTYPELFDYKNNSRYFYKGDEEFRAKLSSMLLNHTPHKTDRFSKTAAEYDWQKKITEYDDLFEELAD